MYPLSLRSVTPGTGFAKLTGVRMDGLPDGVHTGGAYLSPDGKTVWKPLDCLPFANADCLVDTREAEVLSDMQGEPGFPVNWWIENRNGRKWLVRNKALIVGRDIKPSEIGLDWIYRLEQAVRSLNSRYWALGDCITVAFDTKTYEYFILDLSAACVENPPLPADDEWRILHWFKQMGLEHIADFRRRGMKACQPARYLVETPDWPGPEWQHVYGSYNRPISSLWARIDGALFLDADINRDKVWSWVVTPSPLDEDTMYRYELRWAWSPIAYQERESANGPSAG